MHYFRWNWFSIEILLWLIVFHLYYSILILVRRICWLWHLLHYLFALYLVNCLQLYLLNLFVIFRNYIGFLFSLFYNSIAFFYELFLRVEVTCRVQRSNTWAITMALNVMMSNLINLLIAIMCNWIHYMTCSVIRIVHFV